MELFEAEESVESKIRRAKSAHTSPEELLKLAGDENFEVVKAVAANPNCDDAVFSKLKDCDYYSILKTMLKNPKCPFSIIVEFAKMDAPLSDDKYEITPEMALQSTADNILFEILSKLDKPEITREKLLEIASCEDYDVIRDYIDKILANPNCDIAVLYALMYWYKKHQNLYNKYMSITPEELEKLSNSKDIETLRAVARHPNCPPRILAILSKHKEIKVRISVVRNSNCPVGLLKSAIEEKDEKYVAVKHYAIDNPNFPIELMDLLCKRTEKPIKEHIKEEWYITLEGHYAIEVLYKLVENKKTDSKKIDAIVYSKNIPYDIKVRALKHVNCPLKTLVNISAKGDKLSKTAIFVLEQKARNPKTTSEEFEILSTCTIPSVRLLVIKNESCPPEIFVKIAEKEAILSIKAKKKFKKIKDQQVKKEEPKKEETNEELMQNLDELRKQEEIAQMQIEEQELLIERYFDKIKKSSEILGEEFAKNRMSIVPKKRQRIPDEILYVRVGDHKEIAPEYMKFIEYIDFSLSDISGLKVSGIDWSKTNIRIDPQIVYKKDLSNAVFGDDNFIFANFEGCDLRGTDLSGEFESSIHGAITDEKTKLHKAKVTNVHSQTAQMSR